MLGRLSWPVCSLPLELFRLCVGLLGIGWFLRQLIEAPDFSMSAGVLDHQLSREMFWYTRATLLSPRLADWAFPALYALGALACAALAIGWRARAAAAVAFVLAVSTYRYCFMVIFVDDAFVHLALFWCMLLPIGRTLRWPSPLPLHDALLEARQTRVPGFVFRCLCANLAILYATAGAWKLTSALWRNGDALWVALHLPIAWHPELFSPRWHVALRPLAWGALAIELSYPLMHVLRRGSAAKTALALSLVGMHIGIAATMDIVAANVGCLAALLLCYSRELELEPARASAPTSQPIAPWVAGATVTLLAGAMVSGASRGDWREPGTATVGAASRAVGASEGLGKSQRVFYGALWTLGLAQQYQLFDWIDVRGYTVEYTVFETHTDGRRVERESTDFLPRGTRFSLLASYLHGVTWSAVPADRREELRASIGERLALRFCRRNHRAALVEVWGLPVKIDPDSPGGTSASSLVPFQLRFACAAAG